MGFKFIIIVNNLREGIMQVTRVLKTNFGTDKNSVFNRINYVSVAPQSGKDVFSFSNKLSFGAKNPNEETVDWYNQNSQKYFVETKDFSMEEKYPQFLKYLPAGGEVLDAGCGSGRDAKCFMQKGYSVSAFDASAELAKLASENTGLNVGISTFAEFKSPKMFDGIWACASLLHVPKNEFEKSLSNLTDHLKDGGILYATMKLGEAEEKDSKGRFFNYVTVEELKNIFSKSNNLELAEMSQGENTFRVGDHPFVTFVLRKIKK